MMAWFARPKGDQDLSGGTDTAHGLEGAQNRDVKNALRHLPFLKRFETACGPVRHSEATPPLSTAPPQVLPLFPMPSAPAPCRHLCSHALAGSLHASSKLAGRGAPTAAAAATARRRRPPSAKPLAPRARGVAQPSRQLRQLDALETCVVQSCAGAGVESLPAIALDRRRRSAARPVRPSRRRPPPPLRAGPPQRRAH